MVQTGPSVTKPAGTPTALPPTSERPQATRKRPLAWLPLPLFIVAIVVLSFVDTHTKFEPPFLLLALNICFLTCISWIVAYLAARSYIASRMTAVLFLGCGMWVLGIAALIAAVFNSFGMDGHTVTVHNCGSLLSSALILVGALLSTFSGIGKTAEGPIWWLPASYVVSLAAMILVTAGVLDGFIPLFFLPGQRATPLRQMVVVATVIQLAISSMLFARMYRKSEAQFLRWYSLGLGLIAVGMLGLLPQIELGSPINWTARIAQYSGGVYILLAVFAVFRQYHAWDIPVDKALGEIERRHRSLVDLSPDAILVHVAGKYVYANPAAARLFGANSPVEVTGRDVIELVVPEYRDLARERIHQAYAGIVTPLREMRFFRFDGRAIDVESTGVKVDFGGKPAIQLVVRDITLRKQAERALRDSEERYRSLVEMSPDAVFINRDDRIVFLNAAAVELFGASVSAQALGKSPFEMFDSSYHPLMQSRIEQVLAGNTVPLIEAKIIRLDGGVREVEVAASRFSDQGGPAIQVILRDITQRKQAEAMMARYHLITQHARDPLLLIDLDGRIIEANKAAVDLYGYTREDLLNLRLYDLRREGEDEAVTRTIQEATPQGILYETVHVRKDRTYVPVEVSARRVVIDGKPLLLSVVRDITIRKEAEESLRRSERLYRAIGESIEYGVWVCDTDGRNIYASDSFLKMAGMTQEECSSFGWGNALHPDDAERTIAAWKECVRRGGTWDIEHRFRGVDGQWHDVLARGVPVYDEAGRITCWAGINLDISRLKRAEDSLRKAKEELDLRVQERTGQLSRTIDTLNAEMAQRTRAEQALRERSEQLRLLASELTLAEQRERQRLAQVLHDGLQQILVGAKFRLALLGRAEDRDPRQAAVELGELIDDAIETSRSLTAELSPPILREAGLVPALEWLARWMHDKHELTLDLHVERQVEPAAEDVTVVMFQATRELLFNVVKHSGVKSARVRVTPSDGRIQITVADDGLGFDPTQVRAAGGKTGGFGLFSIRERLNLLGGQLEIDSAPSRGSRITLVAPASALNERPRVAPVEQELKVSINLIPSREDHEPIPERRIRVLLADDHVVMRQGLARLLKEEADMVIVGEASDGETAVRLAREILPDVVLMDISMPRMNGIQATRIIHSELPDVRIIGLSMFDEGERAVAMREAGAVDYVTKSGPADAVIAAIRTCVPAPKMTDTKGVTPKGPQGKQQ